MWLYDTARNERFNEREWELVRFVRDERNWELVLILAQGTEQEIVCHFSLKAGSFGDFRIV